jgi:hypothetical protein
MNSNYIDPNYTGRTLLQSNLKKLKSESSKSRFINRFNKRFFILDLNNYYLGYKDKMTSSKIVSYPLTDLINIDPNPRIIDVCDWKFAFVVQIGQRIYHLYADSVSIHNEWCNALKACLKPIEKMVYDCNPPKVIKPEARSSTPDPDTKGLPLPAPVADNDPSTGLLDNSAEKTHSEIPETSTIVTSNYSQKPFSNQGKIEKPGLSDFVKNPDTLKEPSNNVKSAFQPKQQNHSSSLPMPANLGNSGNFQSHPLPVFDKSHSQPAKPESPARSSKPPIFSGPKFEVIKNTLKPEPVTKPKPAKSDDEEFEVISGPVKKIQEVDLTPVVFSKDTLLFKSLGSPKTQKKADSLNDNKIPPSKVQTSEQFFPEKKVAFSYRKSLDEKIEFKSGGILDMLNDFDGLGLETVNVRPMDEVKKNMKSTPKQKEFKEEVKEAFVKPTPPVREKVKLQIKENFNAKDNEFFAPEPQVTVEKKNTIGKVSVKPGFARGQKNAYIEKPDIVPDELPAQNKNPTPFAKKNESAKKEVKSNKFESKSNPQGTDCDWENWDD